MPKMEDDYKSTLIRQGEDATTFRDMVAFAASVETRPLDKLLHELPELGQLSDTKFQLAAQVLRRRFRKETPADQKQLLTYAEEIAGSVTEPELSERIRSIFTGQE
jgi:hypothetical protein